MKTKIALAAAILIWGTVPRAMSQDEITQSGFGASIGAVTFEMKGTTTHHDTNPGDKFLPGSGVPGSAGTTSLDGHQLVFAELGLNYAHPIPAISKRLSWKVELDILAGGGSDDHQNANDSRPAAEGAYVFTACNAGLKPDVGATYHLGDHFYVGADVGCYIMYVNSGWDRYNNWESASRKFSTLFAAGVTLGYDFNRSYGIEGTVEFGDKLRNVFGAVLKYKF